MRIGVMLRDIGNQVDAPGILMLNLMDKILQQDRENDYYLFYKNDLFIHRYIHYTNVKSFSIYAPNKLIWDQISVPIAVKKYKIDLLFHPKHSLPLLVGCKTLMHLRGSGYWRFPDFSKKIDLIYQRLMAPLYVRKATHVIAESDTVKNDFKKFLKIPDEKITRIYLAPNEKFKKIVDRSKLQNISDKYNLPPKFFLTVTRIVENNNMYYPGKNLINSVIGFQKSKAYNSNDIKFVIIGRKTKEFIDNMNGLTENVHNNIITLGFVPQVDLPEIYNLAKFFLFPSINESFGIPLTEAMACGCPIITSNVTACPEIVGSSAIPVNPRSVTEIANAIDLLNDNNELCENLKLKGFEEMKRFSWDISARKHLELISNIFKS